MPEPFPASHAAEESLTSSSFSTERHMGFGEPVYLEQDLYCSYHSRALIVKSTNALKGGRVYPDYLKSAVVAGIQSAFAGRIAYVQTQTIAADITKRLRQQIRWADEITDSYEARFVYKFTGFSDEIRLMSELGPDWNSYGSDPPNGVAIEKALKILGHLFRQNYLPNRVLASAEGGVALVFLSQEKQADIEVFNDGEVLAGIYHLDRDTEIADIQDTDAAIKEITQKIHDFLY